MPTMHVCLDLAHSARDVCASLQPGLCTLLFSFFRGSPPKGRGKYGGGGRRQMEFGHATEERGEKKKGEKWEMRFELRYVHRGQGISDSPATVFYCLKTDL